MVVHFKHHCNTYGSLSAYIVAFVVRLSGGEPLIGLPAFIKFPGYDEEQERQLFPFRTMAMLLSLITLIGVSAYTKYAFESGRLAPEYDYFRCVVNIPEDAIRVGDPSEVGEQVPINLIFGRTIAMRCIRLAVYFLFSPLFTCTVTCHGWSNDKNLWRRDDGWQGRNEWSHQSGNGNRRRSARRGGRAKPQNCRGCQKESSCSATEHTRKHQFLKRALHIYPG